MKYKILFLIPILALTGCKSFEKHQIKKSVTEFYERPVCLEWKNVKQNPEAVKALADAGVLIKKQIRKPAGIMGYELDFDYDVPDQKTLCYGDQFVDKFKAIDFEHDTQGVVSFVVDIDINKEWIKTPFFKKYIIKGKQLRRAYVQKEKNGGWRVIPTQS